jgi:hypothetical protein
MAKQSPAICERTRGRRNRRVANDTLLASAAPQLDADALAELFSYTSSSFWESWQAFVALPEHAQASAALTPAVQLPHVTHRASSKCVDVLHESLHRIDPLIRSLLVQGHVEPLLRKIEEDIVHLHTGRSAELEFILPSARDRMVAHGVAQFYGLSHRSRNTPDMRRITVIRAGGHEDCRRPTVRLADLVCASS